MKKLVSLLCCLCLLVVACCGCMPTYSSTVQNTLTTESGTTISFYNNLASHLVINTQPNSNGFQTYAVFDDAIYHASSAAMPEGSKNSHLYKYGINGERPDFFSGLINGINIKIAIMDENTLLVLEGTYNRRTETSGKKMYYYNLQTGQKRTAINVFQTYGESTTLLSTYPNGFVFCSYHYKNKEKTVIDAITYSFVKNNAVVKQYTQKLTTPATKLLWSSVDASSYYFAQGENVFFRASETEPYQLLNTKLSKPIPAFSLSSPVNTTSSIYSSTLINNQLCITTQTTPIKEESTEQIQTVMPETNDFIDVLNIGQQTVLGEYNIQEAYCSIVTNPSGILVSYRSPAKQLEGKTIEMSTRTLYAQYGWNNEIVAYAEYNAMNGPAFYYRENSSEFYMFEYVLGPSSFHILHTVPSSEVPPDKLDYVTLKSTF